MNWIFLNFSQTEIKKERTTETTAVTHKGDDQIAVGVLARVVDVDRPATGAQREWGRGHPFDGHQT